MKILKWLDAHFEEYISGLSLLVLTVLITVNVVARYCFNNSIPWIDEVARDSMIVAGWFSMGFWLRRNSGICVDAFVSIMPKKVQKFLEVFGLAFTTFFFGICFYTSFRVVASVASSQQYSGNLRVPMQYYYSLVILGFGTAFIRCIQRWYLLVKKVDPKEVDKQ